MENFYMYILQVNIALIVYYLLYRILFSRDTFLEIRRIFLCSVVLLAFLHPLFSMLDWWREEPPLQAVMLGYAEVLAITVSTVAPTDPVFTWQHALTGLWVGGSIILMCRMLLQFGVLCFFISKGKKLDWKGMRLTVLEQQMPPFSFFTWIFVNPAYYEDKELSEILAHERVHVRQWHSVDMLFSELLCIVFWFNPMVWLFRREIRQNLEFLADKMVVCSGYNRKNYQYHLLRLSHQPTAVPLVNNFNVSQLKKRIIMMNKKRTSRMGLVKYALLLPVTGLLMLVGNAPSWAEMADQMIYSSLNMAQEKQMHGMVVDEKGRPIEGVNIYIKGSSTGSVTDKQGKFRINGYDEGILCFSFVGMNMETVKYDKNTKDLKVVMYPETQSIEGVVVNAYETDNRKVKVREEEAIFVVVEDMPRFAEGTVQQYLAKNLRYPESAVKQKKQGKVFLTFIIDKDGKVVEPEVVRGVDPALDQEALRVIRSMPAWKPGKQRGKPVRVKYTLPVQFNLIPDFTSEDKVQKSSSEIQANVLYVVNGKKMPRGFDINTIPVKTIESISVLKDENAIRLYGEEAKGGVIVITTKEEE